MFSASVVNNNESKVNQGGIPESRFSENPGLVNPEVRQTPGFSVPEREVTLDRQIMRQCPWSLTLNLSCLVAGFP